MKENKKINTRALSILDFFCAAIWLITAILNIIGKEFWGRIFLDIVLAAVFFINGLLTIKGKYPINKDDHLDEYKENKEN